MKIIAFIEKFYDNTSPQNLFLYASYNYFAFKPFGAVVLEYLDLSGIVTQTIRQYLFLYPKKKKAKKAKAILPTSIYRFASQRLTEFQCRRDTFWFPVMLVWICLTYCTCSKIFLYLCIHFFKVNEQRCQQFTGKKEVHCCAFHLHCLICLYSFLNKILIQKAEFGISCFASTAGKNITCH